MGYTNIEKRWIAIIVAISLAISGGGIFYYHTTKCNLYDYDPVNDRTTLMKLFKNHTYWLTTNDDYNVEHMFDTKSPNDYQPEYTGKLTVKVARVQGKPVGFVAYYKRKFYQGDILFLVVDEAYRGKGYATKLLKYAINDLFKHHALVVRLVTRTNNYSAMKLYERVGMKETSRTNGFIYFEIGK